MTKAFSIINQTRTEKYSVVVSGNPWDKRGKLFGQRLDGEIEPVNLIADLDCE